MNKSEKRRLKFSLIPPVFFLLIMWLVKTIEYSLDYNWSGYGIFPLKVKNLTGILFSPFLHGDFEHLISNSVPFPTSLLTRISPSINFTSSLVRAKPRPVPCV